MAWCPTCRNEFYNNVKVCPECGVTLVDSLDEIQNLLPLVEGTKDEMEQVLGFLQYNKIDTAMLNYQETENDYLISCSQAELDKAAMMTKIFFQQEDEKRAAETSSDTEAAPEADNEALDTGTQTTPESDSEAEVDAYAETDAADAPVSDAEQMLFHGEDPEGIHIFGTPDENGELKKSSIYKNSAEKAEDNKSSAYTLLGVGGIGLILDLLLMGGVISLPFEDGSRYMVTGVMGMMFLLFIIIGIISFNNAIKYSQKALAENDLTEEIRKWCSDNMNAELIDLELFAEQKYFKRHDKLVKLINDNFLNLEPGYLERFIDDYYTVIFAETKSDEVDPEV